MTADGVVRVTDTEGNVLMEQPVEEKTFSECVRSKTLPFKTVKLAVNRARATNVPTIFWLDENRAHDRKVIEK
jgi:isocitrate dehydrogenase